ncbi:MAG: VIT family protein [Bacteroidia bacterium]|nr:VIT family protein [Bacteroidia bacterium]
MENPVETHSPAEHYIHRSNWLRAAVLGANDGIISISSLAIGVASANAETESLLLATTAGLVAGALSMAAGEYVSVSSQTDIELHDIERERKELETMPERELMHLAEIFEKRGVKKETAMQVARELTEFDALGAHLREELGIHEMNKSNPIQAALASGLAFLAGGIVPLVCIPFFPKDKVEFFLYGITIVLLIILGIVSAKTGGANVKKSIIRVTLWGTLAMGLTASVGYIFGVKI